VLLVLRVLKGELLSCGCDMLREADDIAYLALFPSTMKNLRTLLLEKGMYHLCISSCFVYAHLRVCTIDARSFLRLLCRLAPLRGIYIRFDLSIQFLNFFRKRSVSEATSPISDEEYVCRLWMVSSVLVVILLSECFQVRQKEIPVFQGFNLNPSL
jgi:hypothetical protein